MSDQVAVLRQLLDAQRFAVLATEDLGQPYASLMAFAASQDLTHLVLATERATRKYAHIQGNPRVALLVDDRTNESADTRQGTAVTVLGRAAEAATPERQRLLAVFLAKHPAMADFAASPSCAIIRVQVDVYQIVTHFQNVALHYPT